MRLRMVRSVQRLRPNFGARLSCLSFSAFLPVVSVTCLLASCSTIARAQSTFLPDITKGTIAVRLKAVATGMAAPDYGISAPGDPNRLYVVEQNGLLRVI